MATRTTITYYCGFVAIRIRHVRPQKPLFKRFAEKAEQIEDL